MHLARTGRALLLAAALVAALACSAAAATSSTHGLGFTAKPVRNGIQLSWRTGFQPRTLGWYVYRGTTKLNKVPVFAAGKNAGTVTYTLLDRGPQRRGALYRLQAVGVGGRKTWVASTRR
jgi:hypothetical protein